MKIPNQREHQQTVINHSSEIDYKDFMNLYKKCTAKHDNTLPSDNSLRFRKNLLETI